MTDYILNEYQEYYNNKTITQKGHFFTMSMVYSITLHTKKNSQTICLENSHTFQWLQILKHSKTQDTNSQNYT